MTSFLRLNGIAVPVSATASASVAQETIGKMRRSVNARAVVPRRARKGTWRFSTVLKSAAEALAWRDLISGAGHVVNFDASNPYTSKGMAPVSVAGGWSYTGTGPKYGAACAQWTTGNALWAFFTSSSPWTVAYWLNKGGTGYHHVVVTSGGSSWLDGVLGGSLPVGWGSLLEGFGGVSSGVATFGSASASKIDDIVALPFVVPSSWPAQMYGFGSAFGVLPVLTADGLFIEQNSTISVVGGDSPQGRPVRVASAANFHDFNFELFEQ
jgi:hypothetical protein